VESRSVFESAVVGAAPLWRNFGTRVARESAYVHFVNDSPGPWVAERRIALPIEFVVVDDHAFHRCGGIVSRIAGGAATVGRGHYNTLPVWIEKNLAGIETKASFWIAGSG
jgi:hypothetical protein